jgi:hypothetical protein
MSLTRSLSSFAAFLSLVAVGCDDAAKVLDANNAQPGEADGRAVELTSSPSRFNAIAIDDQNIVVVQQNGDVFQRAKSNAPGPLTQIGSFKFGDSSLSEAISFDTDFIYLINDINGFYRMPRNGGDPEKLDDGSCQSLAVASDSVYFVSHDHTTMRRFDKKTKSVTDWVGGYKYAIAVALDEKGDRVWVADRDAETVSWVPTGQTATGLTATMVAQNQAQPLTIGTDNDYVYWSNSSLSDHKDVTDKIFRLAKDGSGQPQVVTPTPSTFVESPMRADGQYLYFGQSAGGIMRVPVGGAGSATKYLNVCENGFALSSDSLYVVENNTNRFAEADRSLPNRVMAVGK